MTWITRCSIWCTACGGYLLYAGQVKNPHELATAAALAGAAWYWACMLRRCGHRHFAMSPVHAREWVKAVAALGPAIAGTFPLFAKAAWSGRSPGRLLKVRFRRGREDSACDGARRASAVLVASLGPDNFVVCAPPDKDLALMHAILPENASRDACWLNP